MGNSRAHNLMLLRSSGLQLEGRSNGPQVTASRTRGCATAQGSRGRDERGHEGALERVKESENRYSFEDKCARVLYK